MKYKNNHSKNGLKNIFKYLSGNDLESTPEGKNRTELLEIMTQLGLNSFLPKEIPSLLEEHRILIINFYKKLTEFLSADSYNARILLYFPIDWIPEESWSIDDIEVKCTFDHFIEKYKEKWKHLLNIKDIRANFIDGDIPEIENRKEKLPLVIKAAHLIPFLIQKKITSLEEVISIADKSNNKILENSIIDMLPFLFHLDLGSTAVLLKSSSLLIRNSVNYVEQYTKAKPVFHTDIFENLELMKREIIVFQEYIQKQKNEITTKRFNWQKETTIQKIIESYAEQVSLIIIDDPKKLNQLMSIKKRDAYTKIFIINTMKNILEKQYLNKDIIYNCEIIMNYLDELFFSCQNKKIISVLKNIFYKFYSINSFDIQNLNKYKLKPINLFKNQYLNKDYKIINDIVKKIEKSKELSDILYPIVVVYGSTVKGYAVDNADIDLAVFVKENVSNFKRITLQKTLSKLFGKIDDTVVQFWLNLSGEQLIIQDFTNPDKTTGDSFMTQVLFNSIWLGKDKDIISLQKRLFPKYFYLDETTNNREIYLSEIERDVLQYRLMHKGYYYYYPKQTNLTPEYCTDMNHESAFWDRGYRILATKLFIEKVFLPKIIKT